MTATTYTVDRIDQTRSTGTGAALFARLPVETHALEEYGRILTICSLLARNGAQEWRLSEEGCNGPANMKYLDQACARARAAGDEVALERAIQRANANLARWEADHEKRAHANEGRLVALVSLLNQLTGQGWQLAPAGGGLGSCLVIPAGLTHYRADCRALVPGTGREVDAIFLGGA